MGRPVRRTRRLAREPPAARRRQPRARALRAPAPADAVRVPLPSRQRRGPRRPPRPPDAADPDGERELETGDVARFPTGPGGAHQIVNRTDEPVRYVIAAAHADPEVVEHLDSGKVLAMAKSSGPLWAVHRLNDNVDYIEGEEPRR